MKVSTTSLLLLLLSALGDYSANAFTIARNHGMPSKTSLCAAQPENNRSLDLSKSLATAFGSIVLSAALFLGTTTAMPPPALAESSKVVGALKGSGLVFKDTLQIERFEDPKVKGVTLYISNFERPITEKFTKGNFFNDPSYASVACAKTGKVSVADNIAKGTQGEEVFEESRSLLFKTLRVQRVYDEDKKTVVYVSFNTRLDKGEDSNKSRFKSSLCAVSLEDYPTAPAAPPADSI
jgi:catabolite regulation protein CreA